MDGVFVQVEEEEGCVLSEEEEEVGGHAFAWLCDRSHKICQGVLNCY